MIFQITLVCSHTKILKIPKITLVSALLVSAHDCINECGIIIMSNNKKRHCLTIEVKKVILVEQEKKKRSVRQLAADMSLKFRREISRSQIQRLLADTEGRKRIVESD